MRRAFVGVDVSVLDLGLGHVDTLHAIERLHVSAFDGMVKRNQRVAYRSTSGRQGVHHELSRSNRRRTDQPRGTGLDLYSRLLADRVVFLGTEIDDASANLIIGQLLHLESQDPETDIQLYINSPGGSVTAGFGIYDTMQYVRPDVATICVGQAASWSAVLLAAGAPVC